MPVFDETFEDSQLPIIFIADSDEMITSSNIIANRANELSFYDYTKKSLFELLLTHLLD